MPKISVIIPVYNQAEKITACLESLAKQTFQEYEVIIVNDGSTDNLAAALAVASLPYKLINQANQGSNAARNRGWREAQGEYLLFCDADLVLAKTMLQKMLAVLEGAPAVTYVYSSYRFGWKLYRGWPYSVEKLRQVNVAHTTSLIRRAAFPGFDEKIKRLQDWDLWLTISEQGGQGSWLPEVLFTVKTGGTMSNWLPSFCYRFSWLPLVKKYRQAEAIIRAKHQI
jgi:glycosyltransferase involved in cell wall biosynthesis